MKPHRYIGIVFFIVMVACTRPDGNPVETRHGTAAAPELSAIDSLMWQRPDSALMLLLPCLDTCCAAEYDRHYANLLLAELLYKNYEPQENRAQLQQAVAYFDSFANNVPPTTAFLAARAHYINGVGYYEMDSAVPACKEYIKALEIMENHFTEKDLVGDKARFMAFTYTRLTDLFADLYLHEQAIYFSKRALEYYTQINTSSRQMARMLEEIGSHYDMMGQLDSAYCYYNKGMDLLSDTNNLTYRDLVTHLAFLAYYMGESSLTSVNQLQATMCQSESQTETLSRCTIIGEIYYHENQYDSAYIYLSKVFHESQNVGAKKQAAEWLVEICKVQNRDSEIFEYADFLVPFATQDENKGIIKSQLTERCNDYMQKESEVEYQDRMKRIYKTANKAIVLLISIISVVSFLYFVNTKRQKKMKIQQEETEKLLETERHSHRMQQAALTGKLKKSHDSLRLQSEKVARLQEEIKKGQFIPCEANYEAFLQEIPCQEIIKSLEGTNIKRISVAEDYPGLSLTPQKLSHLAIVTENYYQGFADRLRSLYPKITAMDLDICRLLLLGVNEKQVSILLHRDYSTIMEHVRKIKKAFKTESNLGDYIRYKI